MNLFLQVIFSLALPSWLPKVFIGIKGDVVVRVLASHQCGLGSIPRPDVICGLSLLLVLSLLREVFLRVLQFSIFASPQKATFLNSNSIRNSRATGLAVARQLSVTLVKQSRFIYLFILLINETRKPFHCRVLYRCD